MKLLIFFIYILVIGNSIWSLEGLVIRINNWFWYLFERIFVIFIIMFVFDIIDNFIWMGIRYFKIYFVNIVSLVVIFLVLGF